MKATFFHAGCPVCLDAEQQLVHLLDRDIVDVEIVHLGEQANRLPDAQDAGVKSVTALVIDGAAPIHLNHGADLSALA